MKLGLCKNATILLFLCSKVMIGVKNIYGYNAGFKDVERTAEKPELKGICIYDWFIFIRSNRIKSSEKLNAK